VGTETSKTRHALLDAVERLMLEQGYAGVTYRALAAKASVTPALVQYYFPTLDDVFLAAIRRSVDRSVNRLVAALQERRDEPRRVMWEFSRDEATAALMIEFTAVGNRRTSIKAEIGQATEKLRQVQLDALSSIQAPPHVNGELSPPALVFLLTAIPKLLKLEASVGVSTAHAEVVDAFERYLDAVEPRSPRKRRPRPAPLTSPRPAEPLERT
jgi:AcrR family transcriptional regulator